MNLLPQAYFEMHVKCAERVTFFQFGSWRNVILNTKVKLLQIQLHFKIAFILYFFEKMI
jgi:hypothetical protein